MSKPVVPKTAHALASLKKEYLTGAERTIEDRLRDWAFDLITHERWGRVWRKLNEGPFYRDLNWRRDQLLHIVREFGGDYAQLLERAAVDYVRELRSLFQRFQIDLSELDVQEISSAALQFSHRFTEGLFERPWEGFFVLPPTDSQEKPSRRMLLVDFQRVNPLARVFADAEHLLTPGKVAEAFSGEIGAENWNNRAAAKMRNELSLVTTGKYDKPPQGRLLLDPDVAKRRSIVKGNPDMEASGLILLFGSHHIPLTKKMREAKTWEKAWAAPAYRHAIESMISRDRKS